MAGEFMSRKEAAIYLTKIGCKISALTLQKYACNRNAGKGPPYTKRRSQTVQYERSDLDTWAKKEAVKIT